MRSEISEAEDLVQAELIYVTEPTEQQLQEMKAFLAHSKQSMSKVIARYL